MGEDGDQGWEARGLRQSRHGEGEAGQDRREGLPREGPQGRVLMASRSGGELREEGPRVLLQFLPLAPPAPPPRPPPLTPALAPSSLGCHFVQAGWRVRGQAWPSGPRLPGEGDHMYSTPVSQSRRK